MALTRRILMLLGVFCISSLCTRAQVTTGTPPFGSFGGGPDVINLANLNAHLGIAVLNKPGRGAPFNYNLTYDSSIWSPVTSGGATSWQPATYWGWATQSAVATGYITYSTTTTICWLEHNVIGGTKTVNRNYVYTDQFGVPHKFAGYTQAEWGTCGSTNVWITNSVTTDGSGYTLNVNPNIVVTSRAGTVINPEYGTSSGSTAVDRNGNEITVSTGGVLTDTLGTTALTVSGSNPVALTYTPPAGGSATYKIVYSPHTVQTNFGCSGITEFGPTAESLVSEIDLPDGTKYLFSYEQTPGHSSNVTGRLASVTFPTGGTINYTYTGGSNGIECADGSTAGFARQTPDGTWTYSRTLGGGAASTTTITAPTYNGQSNQTVMNFQGIYPTETEVYQGSSSGGTLLKTTLVCYNGSAPTGSPATCNSAAITLPITQRTVYTQLPGTTVLESESNAYYNPYGLPTEIDEYTYGSGSPGLLVRKTLTSYASLSNGIVSAPSQITVQDGSGNVKAQTTYGYDQTAVTATSGTPQQVSISGSRGNVTTISYLVSGSTTLSKTFTYYDTGNVNVATDVNGTQTTYTYGSGSCGNSFVTSISEPLSLSKSITWNCMGGVTTSTTDENGKTVSMSFTDSYFWRANSTTDALSNTTNLAYASQNSAESSLVFNGSTSDALSTLDGLGRTEISQRRQGPSSGTYDSTETVYDALGRPYKTTLPYPASAGQLCSGTCPGTTTIYDALSRPVQTTDGGGGTRSYTYSQNDTYRTLGPAPSGENTKRKQFEYDALGRLTSICEITNAGGSGTCGQHNPQTGYWTEYSYDANNKLTGVTQNAQSGNPQTRTYVYDDLGRITSETNPESGTIRYTYDSDPTCGTSYGDLVKKVDAAGNTICYSYDARHRLTSTTYSGTYASVTPSQYFVYDSATVNSVTMVNASARMAEAYTCFSPCSTKLTDIGLSYTARGEVSDIYESMPHSGGYYHVNQTYWANGAIDQLSGLSGLPTITYSVDGEGRIYSVAASSGQNPLSSTSYNVAGSATQINLGSSDSDSFTYDQNTNRMTQYSFDVNGQSVVGTVGWNALGTIASLSVTDPFNSANAQTCSYSHDDLTRVASVSCGSVWSQTFSYDAFGNLQKSGTSTFQPIYSAATNQMTSIGGSTPTYDADGNVTNDFLHTYAWDANGRPVTMDGVGATYDALGRMVEQNRSGAYTEIVYTPSGAKLALMSGSTLQKGFVPLTGGSMAVYNSSGLAYYRHSDWVGSSRFASTPTRAMYSDGAYAPFGEPYAQAGTSDLSFTGMNQDTVANLYDFPAREYGIQGRWPSPDPSGVASANPADPQTWNRYAYARNSPLSSVDPTGLFAYTCSSCGGGIAHQILEAGWAHGASEDWAFSWLGAVMQNFYGGFGSGSYDTFVSDFGTSDDIGSLLASTTTMTEDYLALGYGYALDAAGTSQNAQSAAPSGVIKLDTANLPSGGIDVRYQIVDSQGRPIDEDVAVQEHVQVILALNAEDISNPNYLPAYSGIFLDAVGPQDPVQSNTDAYLHTEQTFTVLEGDQTYYLTTKIDQYILIQNGQVTASTVISVP